MIPANDLALWRRAKAGDARAEDELARSLEDIVRLEAGDFFLPGQDADDVLQEARVGLLRAIQTYDPERGFTTFRNFARFAIRRQLVTALKGAQRLKHRPLTDSARSGLNADGELAPIIDLLPSSASTLEQIEKRAEIAEIAWKIRTQLTRVEAHCLILFANGLSYEEIERFASLASTKAVDQAITRARWKLRGIGPPSEPRFAQRIHRREYVCPGCGGATVRVNSRGQECRGPGRPPLCNVCTLRKLAA